MLEHLGTPSRSPTPGRGGAPGDGIPLVMGILNVTPDSFSDGGRFLATSDAVEHALAMIRDGADIIDVGPESSRPGSMPVEPDEQIRRAIPVIERIATARRDVRISIDTRLSSVAAAAIDAGATIVNDISALRDDPRMAGLVAERGATLILMHMRGQPADMQKDPVYRDVVAEVLAFLTERAARATKAGVSVDRIVLDPGIGFGKTVEHNLILMRNIERFVAAGFAVLLGASRKSFLGKLADEPDASNRLGGSLACVVRAMAAGVRIVRVHDVRQTRQLIDTLGAIGE